MEGFTCRVCRKEFPSEDGWYKHYVMEHIMPDVVKEVLAHDKSYDVSS